MFILKRMGTKKYPPHWACEENYEYSSDFKCGKILSYYKVNL
jgi:hypothetical protein